MNACFQAALAPYTKWAVVLFMAGVIAVCLVWERALAVEDSE